MYMYMCTCTLYYMYNTFTVCMHYMPSNYKMYMYMCYLLEHNVLVVE